MDLEIYDDAVAEYLDNIERTVQELQVESSICDETFEYTLENARKSIQKYLETNRPYAQLLMDLKHLEYKDKSTYSLTEIAKKKDESNSSYIIQSWLSNVNTLELLCL
ncbi:MAG: hypothetical protein HDT28_03255 [Clostridiales bacterium]|nr:hypothetical protein [Clostridiales bacterium]